MQIISKGLKFTYNKKTEFKRQALNGVDLTINEGDFFGIIGQTGSGKSTFIEHLNGLIPVESGELTIGEFDLSVSAQKPKKAYKERLKLLRRKVGMVFQYPEYQLFAETVFEDVAFGIKNFFPEIEGEQLALKVKNALELVGLNYYEVKDKSPFELSGGQKRRVAIAGVLVLEPEVLVLDEPVAGLDPVGKRNLMELLHSLHGTVLKTIVIVSHDMDEVSENCNRVAVFSDGVAVKVDTIENIFADVDFLVKHGLELPLTAKIKEDLKAVGVDIITDYKIDNLIEKIYKNYKG
ncbi:MAG: energy-coupling factor transporter ATPase [Clostridia bacterium]|nr:energy-coupling factor transporter ATPase [Clostridia bacterium]